MKKKNKSTMFVVLLTMFTLLVATPICSMASSLDDLAGQSVQAEQVTPVPETSGGSEVELGGFSDWLRDHEPITTEQMEKAGTTMSPIANFLGYVSGLLLIAAAAFLGVTTGADLLYIAAPVLRPILDPQGANAGAQMANGGGMPMGGMGSYGGGYGMRGGYGMGGMGGMMNSGATQPQPTGGFFARFRLISDECRAAVAETPIASAQAQAPIQSGMMGGYGMGMGMGMGGMQQPQPAPVTGSLSTVMSKYLKKRAIFIVCFAIATIVLTSSVLLDCGINIAELILKIVNAFSGKVSNVNI